MGLKVICYNEVSIDGSVIGFDFHSELFYQIVGEIGAQALLVGSATAVTGIEMFMGEIPPEKESDFIRPEVKADDKRLLWVLIDSQGVLLEKLQVFRRFEYCKDVIVFVSEKTPQKYLDYLSSRNYRNHIIGTDKVDLKRAVEILENEYSVHTISVDSGGILGGALMNAGLVDEIGIIISPHIVGKTGNNLFRNWEKPPVNVKFKLEKIDRIEDNYVRLLYKVEKQ